MENLKLQNKSINDALVQLKIGIEIVEQSQDCSAPTIELLQAGVIQRFEVSYDTFWKYIKLYLTRIHTVDEETLISPRTIFKRAQRMLLISRTELNHLMDMSEDRSGKNVKE